VVNRIVAIDEVPDAKKAHELKKFLDEQIDFSKTPEGVKGKTLNIIKDLRRDINESLKSSFDDYRDANEVFSDTRGAMDEMQDAVGSKLDFSKKRAAEESGTRLRSILSLNQSRDRLLRGINALEESATKHGAEFDDNILKQVMFVEELEQAFPEIIPKTSLKGRLKQAAELTAKAAKGDLSGAAKKVGDDFVGGISPQDQDAAIKSIRTLLGN
jgi:hypothetical protein